MKRAIVCLAVSLVLFAAILPGPAARRLLLVAGRRRGRRRLTRSGGPRHLAALGALRRVSFRRQPGPYPRPRTTRPRPRIYAPPAY